LRIAQPLAHVSEPASTSAPPRELQVVFGQRLETPADRAAVLVMAGSLEAGASSAQLFTSFVPHDNIAVALCTSSSAGCIPSATSESRLLRRLDGRPMWVTRVHPLAAFVRVTIRGTGDARDSLSVGWGEQILEAKVSLAFIDMLRQSLRTASPHYRKCLILQPTLYGTAASLRSASNATAACLILSLPATSQVRMDTVAGVHWPNAVAVPLWEALHSWLILLLGRPDCAVLPRYHQVPMSRPCHRSAPCPYYALDLRTKGVWRFRTTTPG